MTTENKIMVRGDNETLTWTYSGDLSARKIIFVVKENRTLTSSRVIQRKNVAAGGADIQLTATYSAVTLLTTITVFLTPALTQALTAKDYFYDITSEDASDSDDHETILQGKFTLVGDVQSPYDGEQVAGSMDAAKKIRFYVSGDSVVAKVTGSDYGWTSTPTAVAVSGVITISSGDSEFVVGKTFIHSTNTNINYPSPTIDEIVITVLEDEYPFTIEVAV